MSARPRPLFLVDVFAERPFAGNPAAVVLLGARAQTDWMQLVAAELGRPATAFLDPERLLRWFTPTIELDLCGHGTVATAHVLWERGLAPRGPLRFTTGAGPVDVADDDGVALVMLAADAPAATVEPGGLAAALGAAPEAVLRCRHDLLAVYPDAAAVESLAPDLEALAAFDCRGVVATAAGGAGGADVTSRFFAPRLGVGEDAATGSAHAPIGTYWARRLGSPRLRCRQASARGGWLDVRVDGARVQVGGRAVTVAVGDLVVD